MYVSLDINVLSTAEHERGFHFLPIFFFFYFLFGSHSIFFFLFYLPFLKWGLQVIDNYLFRILPQVPFRFAPNFIFLCPFLEILRPSVGTYNVRSRIQLERWSWNLGFNSFFLTVAQAGMWFIFFADLINSIFLSEEVCLHIVIGGVSAPLK